jgi:hypothetical protein
VDQFAVQRAGLPRFWPQLAGTLLQSLGSVGMLQGVGAAGGLSGAGLRLAPQALPWLSSTSRVWTPSFSSSSRPLW